MIKTGDIEYFELLELQDYLKAHRLDKLGLENIDRLRSEIEIKIEEIHCGGRIAKKNFTSSASVNDFK